MNHATAFHEFVLNLLIFGGSFGFVWLFMSVLGEIMSSDWTQADAERRGKVSDLSFYYSTYWQRRNRDRSG